MKRLEVVEEEVKIVLLLLDQELANCRYVQREAGTSASSNLLGRPQACVTLTSQDIATL